VTDAFEVDIEFLDVSGDGIARAGRRTLAIPFAGSGDNSRFCQGASLMANVWPAAEMAPDRAAPVPFGCTE
jgi:tRNA/tmRNA/rRNA uracil-C5-methylase (TrmA/RlmC/RlmD family)